MEGFQPYFDYSSGKSGAARTRCGTIRFASVLGVSADDLFPPNLRKKIKTLWPQYRVKLSRGQVPPNNKQMLNAPCTKSSPALAANAGVHMDHFE